MTRLPGAKPSTSMPKTCWVSALADLGSAARCSRRRRSSRGAARRPVRSPRPSLDGDRWRRRRADGCERRERRHEEDRDHGHDTTHPGPSSLTWSSGLRNDARRAVDRQQVVALVPRGVAAVEPLEPARGVFASSGSAASAASNARAQRRILREHRARLLLGDVRLHVLLALERGVEEAPLRERVGRAGSSRWSTQARGGWRSARRARRPSVAGLGAPTALERRARAALVRRLARHLRRAEGLDAARRGSRRGDWA